MTGQLDPDTSPIPREKSKNWGPEPEARDIVRSHSSPPSTFLRAGTSCPDLKAAEGWGRAGAGCWKNCNTLALCKAIFHYRRTEQKLKHEAQCPAAGLVTLPLAQFGLLLEACPLGDFERSHPFPAFVSEGEPGESHMTMRLPVDTFVMSAASGICQAEGKVLLSSSSGWCGVFCVCR